MKQIKIANKKIGDGNPCFIIAEAGSNHNGNLATAKKLIDTAVLAGADAVKFQNFSADTLYPKTNKGVKYLGNKEPIYDIIKKAEMPKDWVPKLALYAKRKGIIFFSAVFSEQDADLVAPHVPAFKIGSYEIDHVPLIKYVSQKKKPVIISTGTATSVREVKNAVKAIKSVGNNNVCVMQCTGKYPTPIGRLNVKVIEQFKKEFNVPVGLSDHSAHALYGAAAAVSVGANLYEKHFTLDKNQKGPDHSFALNPKELKQCIDLIRNTEKAVGSSIKELQKVEKELFDFRRAVYTTKPIKKGELITKDNTKILRKPGIAEKGILPVDYNKVLNKKVKKNILDFVLLKKSNLQ
jgi:N-acetylneuraminate synthase